MSDTQVPADLEDRIRRALHERADAMRTSYPSLRTFDTLPPTKPHRGRAALIAVAVVTVAAVSIGLWVGVGRFPSHLVRTPVTSRSPQELVSAGLFTQADFPPGWTQRPTGPRPSFSKLGTSCRTAAAALKRATAQAVSPTFMGDQAYATDVVSVFPSTTDAKAFLSTVQGTGPLAPPCLTKALNAANALASPPGSGVTFFPASLTRLPQVRLGDQTIAYETSITAETQSNGYVYFFDEIFTRVNRVVIVSLLDAGHAPSDQLGPQVRGVTNRVRALTGPALARAPSR